MALKFVNGKIIDPNEEENVTAFVDPSDVNDAKYGWSPAERLLLATTSLTALNTVALVVLGIVPMIK